MKNVYACLPMRSPLTFLLLACLAPLLCTVSCSSGVFSSGSSGTASIRIILPNQGSRALIADGGYLLVRTLGGPSGDAGPLYGPYAVKGGEVTIEGLPSGDYSDIVVIHTANDISGVETSLNDTVTIGQLLSSQDNGLASPDFDAACRNELILAAESQGSMAHAGKTTIRTGVNLLKITLVPMAATTVALNPDSAATQFAGTVEADTSGASCFVALEPLSSVTPATWSLPRITITATSSSLSVAEDLALYDGNGGLIKTFSSSDALSSPFTVDVPASTLFYLRCSVTAAGTASLCVSYFDAATWYVSDSVTAGTNDGRSLSSPCLLSEALAAAAAEKAITVATPARIGIPSSYAAEAFNVTSPVSFFTTDTGSELTLKTTPSSGAFITVDGGSLSVSGVAICTNSTSAPGGLLSVSNGGSITLGSGSSVQGNGTGGATPYGGVYVGSGGKLIIDGGTVYGNTATNGAGVFVAEGGVFTLKSGGIHTNHATNAGAGVYVAGGSVHLEGGGIYGNTYPSGTTSLDGAGLYATTSSSGGLMIDLRGTSIYGNTAYSKGGGVYLSSNCTLNMTGGEIGKSGTGNTAMYGGGIYAAAGASLAMTGGAVSGNTAENGGGVYGDGSAVTLAGGSVNGNTASVEGGGFYLKDGSFTLPAAAPASPLVTENTAGWGGGIWANDSNVPNLTNSGTAASVFSGNTASEKFPDYYIGESCHDAN